jgi:hypothetical protein
MTRYRISFDDGSMDHIPADDRPAGGEASHARQAKVVAADGTISDGPDPETKAVVGGFSIIDVPSRDEALIWAARFARACRCAQEVREIMDDPLV